VRIIDDGVALAELREMAEQGFGIRAVVARLVRR
jgi:hypothetical protein